eukprot:67283-Prymnesium_polylepis.1
MSSKVLALRFLSGSCDVFGDFGDFGTLGIGWCEGGRCCVCGRVEVVGSVRRKLAGRVIADQMASSKKIRRL